MRQVETERKLTVAEGEPLPSPGGRVVAGASREHRMRAVYVDTTDLLLARHRMTLRRREGGSDAGWHLKLPRPDGSRLEIHAPLGEGPGRLRVPEELRSEVRAAFGTAWPEGAAGALLPSAVLTTRRLEVDLLATDGSGTVLAQLCDDEVSALPAGLSWRELEVELVEGDEELLDAVVAAMVDQGAEPAAHPSKVALALGERPARAHRGEAPPADGPAADVVHAYLAAQVAVLLGREEDLRADAPDAVHKVRVATRRLRSCLRTVRRLLDREVTDPLREEVRWYAGVLGAPRDAEVVRDRVLDALADLPEADVVGPVRERVVAELDARHAAAHAELVETLGSERYLRLTDALVELLAEPPWRGRARRDALVVLPPLVSSAVGRARGEARAASATTGADRLRRLHEARKRAKAVRYACEAVAPSLGDEAAGAAARWERVTEALGDVQDSVVAVERLHELAAAAQAAGEPTFTYGLLAGLEAATHDDDALAAALAVLEDALDHGWPEG